jgi:predicted nucleic acid-binding protein
MKQAVIVDTGVLVALLNKNDEYHQWASAQLKRIQPPLLTCEAIIFETFFLCGKRQQAVKVIFNYLKAGIIKTPFVFANEYDVIEKLMLKYADVPMSLADACLVRLSEQYQNSCVFTLDSDFLIYRKNGNEMISLIYPENK